MYIIERLDLLLYNGIMVNFFSNSNENSGSMIISERQEQIMMAQNQISNEKKRKGIKIILILVIVGVVVAGIVGYLAFNFLPREFRCVGNKGSISIFYNSKELIKYESVDMTMDFEAQKNLAKEKGVEVYLKEFDDWFFETSGKRCVK